MRKICGIKIWADKSPIHQTELNWQSEKDVSKWTKILFQNIGGNTPQTRMWSDRFSFESMSVQQIASWLIILRWIFREKRPNSKTVVPDTCELRDPAKPINRHSLPLLIIPDFLSALASFSSCQQITLTQYYSLKVYRDPTKARSKPFLWQTSGYRNSLPFFHCRKLDSWRAGELRNRIIARQGSIYGAQCRQEYYGLSKIPYSISMLE